MGPVITSPDGLFPSLYRELVLRRPHEFKIRYLCVTSCAEPSQFLSDELVPLQVCRQPHTRLIT